MRIGHGYDIHRFEESSTKNHVVLGGVEIPYQYGLIAHSDGDVVVHAICDAILGAAGLGDIGNHFPDTNQKFKSVSSRKFLSHVIKLIVDKQYKVGNVDVTIIAQAPKIQPHVLAMKEVLSQDLQISINDINIKATTNEGLDALGNKLGIAAHAVVLLKS